MLNTILIIAVLYAIHTAVAALPTWLFVVAQQSGDGSMIDR